MRRHVAGCALFWMVLLTEPAGAADWTRFRGPQGLGMSREVDLPAQWSAEENVVWRTALPGLGTSSPITVGNRVYLTCYSGYGIEPNRGAQENLLRHLVCLDRQSGEIQWTKDFAPAFPESNYEGGNSSWHGYSSSTPTTDGNHLFVFFGASGVFCLDLDGNQRWHAEVGDRTHRWGSATSPLLYEDLVIINASVESQSLVALHKETGEEVWRTGGIQRSWNTPNFVELEDGRVELVVSIQKSVLGLEPRTGEQLWHCDGIPTYVCPSIIMHQGIVFASGGRGKQFVMAIQPGGRGDVTESHRLWVTEKGSNVSSPVFHQGFIYCANDRRGIAFCFNAETGEVVYEERLKPRPGVIYASATVADGKIYYVSQHEGIYVVAAKPEFELLHRNRLGEDTSRTNAGVVISGGQLLIRNDRYLYCIGHP